MKYMKVDYLLSDEQVERLEGLLQEWKQYQNPEGEYPFKDWDIEKVFSALMTTGCSYDIDKRMEFEERRQEATHAQSLQ